jgi:uncharacterized repeat protein (TIGR04138 family)
MNFHKKVSEIIEKDPRFKADAYEFVMQALVHAQTRLKREGHISGRELLVSLRDLALEQYGPLTKTVLAHWGVQTTYDFGDIVFNMVENGLMSKTDQDSKDEFREVYNFDTVFNVFGK